MERYLAGEELPHTFGYYCGLQSLTFPPPEQLDIDDLKKVCEAFKQMMLSWNLSIDLPDNLPLPLAYSMMVDTLNTKTDIPTSGILSFNFCTGHAPDCIFKSYCSCLKYRNEDEVDLLCDPERSEGEYGERENNISESDELPF